MKLVKSCINYTGGKYRLLKQLLPLFPSNINCFVDLFCGAANVSLNVNANKYYCFDNNKPLIKLFNFILSNKVDFLIDSLFKIISEYNLSLTDKWGYEYYNCTSNEGLAKFNKNQYNFLREDYNNSNLKFDESLYLYLLIVYGFNNQIRFNKKNFFNIPVGKRDFNKNTRKNLRKFHSRATFNNLQFYCRDFRDVNFDKLSKRDFVYADPPYLITTASYNEQNKWTINDEKDLLNILDNLNERGIKFALSNVLESRGKENKLLKSWSKKYTVNFLNYDYNNSNYQIKDKSKSVEVLICNY